MTESIDARDQERVQRVGDGDVLELRGRLPAKPIVGLVHDSLLDQGTHDLLDEVGVSFGLFDDELAQVARKVGDVQERRDQVVGSLTVERREGDLRVEVRIFRLRLQLELPARRLALRPERAHEEHRPRLDDAEKMDQKVHRSLIRPVNVVEDADRRVGGRVLPGVRGDLVEVVLDRLRPEVRGVLDGFGGDDALHRHFAEGHRLRRRVTEPLLDFFVNHGRRIVELDAEHVARELLEESVGAGGVVRTALDLLPREGGVFQQPHFAGLVEQTTLSESRLADETHDPTAAFLDALHRLAQYGHFAIAPDERRADTLDAAEPARLGLGAEHAVRADGRALALHLDPAEVLEIENRRYQSLRILGDLNRAGVGSLFHARGEVHGVAHGRVFHDALRTDVSRHHGTRVDADANREVEAVLLFDLRRERLDLVQDLECSKNGPLRIVLVRDRSAEERQNGVAHEAGDGALVALDGAREDRERAVHDFAPIFGIQLFGERGRSDDVAKERGDDAPFTLRGGCFRSAQDVLEHRSHAYRLGRIEPLTTALTETSLSGVRSGARGARRREHAATAHAESGFRSVVRLALGAFHLSHLVPRLVVSRPRRRQISG
jgi:hypothetical protein